MQTTAWNIDSISIDINFIYFSKGDKFSVNPFLLKFANILWICWPIVSIPSFSKKKCEDTKSSKIWQFHRVRCFDLAFDIIEELPVVELLVEAEEFVRWLYVRVCEDGFYRCEIREQVLFTIDLRFECADRSRRRGRTWQKRRHVGGRRSRLWSDHYGASIIGSMWFISPLLFETICV